METFKQRFFGLCVPPLVLALADASVTSRPTPRSHCTEPLRWIRRAAIVAWLAWLASYALMVLQGVVRVMHPHFLPLLSVMLLGFVAGISAVGLGSWRIVRGPGRLAAVGWLCFASIPMLLWLAHGSYALAAVRTTNRPIGFRLKLAGVAAAAAADGLARLVYPNRLAGEHTVMIYDDCDDPEADAAAMDLHIEQVGRVLGRPLPTTVHWVRGGLLGIRGLSFFGVALCGIEETDERGSSRLSYVDRHEAAHNVLNDQLPITARPPTVFMEGWAESQSGVPSVARAREMWERRRRGRAHSIRQLLSPEWYGNADFAVYVQGGLLVDFLVRRYGGDKFFTLCATCRPKTIADDCQRVYGADLERLDELFWADLRERAFAKGPMRQQTISAELGLAMDGPSDESAREEFLRRYAMEVEKLKEVYRHVRISRKREPFKTPTADDRSSESRIELIRDGDRVRLTDECSDNVLIYVATPENSFILQRSPPQTRFRTVRASPKVSYASVHDNIRAREPELDAPYFPLYHDLEEWMNLPCFTVTRAVRVQDGARRLVKVYFEYSIPEDDAPYLAAGWVLMRPDEGWAIDACEVHSKGIPPEIRGSLPKNQQAEFNAIRVEQGTVRYRGSHEGIPVLESVEWKYLRAGKLEFARPVRITDIRFGPAPDETFDLASFDADPPREQGHTVVSKEDVFLRLTRWLVGAIWFCSAAVVVLILPPLVRRVATGKREVVRATSDEGTSAS